MNKNYIPSQATQDDLIKSVDKYVALIFKNSKDFLKRNKMEEQFYASLPMSVSLTILLFLVRGLESKESLDSFKSEYLAKIDEIFLSSTFNDIKIH